MTALEEWELLAETPIDVEKTLPELLQYITKVGNAAIESLKCCGNCGHMDVDYEDIECCDGEWDIFFLAKSGERLSIKSSTVNPYDRCHFSPSRWQERTDG